MAPQPDSLMGVQCGSEQFILETAILIFTKAEQVVLFHYFFAFITYIFQVRATNQTTTIQKPAMSQLPTKQIPFMYSLHSITKN